MPPMVLIHWQLHSNTALCSCGASAALCASPLFLPFGSSFKCSKSGKTRQMRPKSRNFLWRCAAGKKDLVGLSAERKKGHFSVEKMRSLVMVTFRRQKPAGSSFHEYTRQVPGRVSSLLAWIMRKCGTKLCHILQQVSLYNRTILHGHGHDMDMDMRFMCPETVSTRDGIFI